MKNSAASLKRLFDVTDYLVDDHVGIIRCVSELKREPGAPDFFHFYARACNTQVFCRQMNFGNAGGASADRSIAMAKAIGEAVERYCSAIFEHGELPLVSFDSAPFQCVTPSEFALYSPEQYAEPDFPYLPFVRSTPVRWTAAFDPATAETWYVPAAMAYMPYFFDKKLGEIPITQRISTGLACHCSQAEAAISAICEVIERDAFTITWQAQLKRPHIQIDTLSDYNYDLVERFERTGGSVTLFNITMDHGIPTVLGILRRNAAEAPSLVFAASASLSPEEAVRKSLEELAHTGRLAHQLKTKLPPLVPGHYFENVLNQDDHVHLYCDHSNAKLTEFLYASCNRIEFNAIENLATGDPEKDLNILIEKVRSVGHKVLLADLTTPDVGDLGLVVIRAIIPGFHPLFIGHRLRALGGDRLWTIPQKLGYPGIRPESGDNPAPHPYP